MSNETTYSQTALTGMTCAAAISIAKPATVSDAVVAGLIVVAKLKNLEPSF
jgi:hypothetical protein